jgi:hypothetical protein
MSLRRASVPPSSVVASVRSASGNEVRLPPAYIEKIQSVLREAHQSVAILQDRVQSLEADLEAALDRAFLAEESGLVAREQAEALVRNAEARLAGQTESFGAGLSRPRELEAALARSEAQNADLTSALQERDHRVWSAEARALDDDVRASQALERGSRSAKPRQERASLASEKPSTKHRCSPRRRDAGTQAPD